MRVFAADDSITENKENGEGAGPGADCQLNPAVESARLGMKSDEMKRTAALFLFFLPSRRRGGIRKRNETFEKKKEI